MSGPLVLAPVFKERLWGGQRLSEWYGDLVPDGTIGEAWAISGMPGDAGLVVDGPGAGGTLDEAWRSGLVTGTPRDDDFPLLVKLLDPADWLSVQVHPDDDQARLLEDQPRGKAECWLIVEAAPGAEIILGHRDETAAALRRAFDDRVLETRLLRQPVGPGSFFMIPAGCVHAIGPGMLIYEVQQASDITYRMYDFDRRDKDGRPRDLHVDKAFSVITAPYDVARSLTALPARPAAGGTVRPLVDNDHFTVRELRIDGRAAVGSAEQFELLTVVGGSGILTVDGVDRELPRGTSLVLPAGVLGSIAGTLTVVATRPGPSA